MSQPVTADDGLAARLKRALVDLTGKHYPLPWQVARRSYDHEQVIASDNLVLASGLACAGNTEQRKALVEIVNAVPEIIASLSALHRGPVDDWFAAHDAYHRASDTYNERLAFIRAERERGNWSMNTEQEYRALCDAQSAAFQASETLYQQIRSPHIAEHREVKS